MKGMRVIDATTDQVESAKETVLALMGDNSVANALDLFYTSDLGEIERRIRDLNNFSNRAWILSAILLYTLIYDKQTYQQSGLDWFSYVKESRARLGIDQRDITEQLSAARFFILYHKRLERAGFSADSANRKLARAELALRLSGDIDAVVAHLVGDTWAEFNAWYQGFKKKGSLIADANRRDDFSFDGGRFTIGGKDAVIVADDIDGKDRERLKGYIREIFAAIRDGYEPAIVPTYDRKEAAIMVRLRDKHRRGK